MESVTHYQILNQTTVSSSFCFSGNVCFYSVNGQFMYLVLQGNYIMST